MTELDSFPEGSTAFVQGASRGIGLEMVRRILGLGRFHRVYASARRATACDALSALAESSGGALVPVDMDVTEPADLARAAARVGAEVEALHLLINASGLLHDAARGIHPEKRLEDVDAEALMRVFQVNAFAPLLMTRHLLPVLARGERAVVANISARVGSIGDNRLGGWYAYRGSKAAQNMFTRGIAIECARRARSVICLALHPGTTDTALSGPFQARVPEGKLFSPAFSAACLLDIIDGATAEDSGGFFGWDGAPIAW